MLAPMALATVLLAGLLLAGCASDEGNDPQGAGETTVPDTAGGRPRDAIFMVSVADVAPGAPIPARYTCDGANETPEVTFSGVPQGTQSLALVVDDPDAPSAQPFVHWVVYDIAPDATGVDDPDRRHGINDAAVSGWFGPCPPAGDGPHTYRWRLFAVGEDLDLGEDLDGRALEAAIAGAVLGEASTTGVYERRP